MGDVVYVTDEHNEHNEHDYSESNPGPDITLLLSCRQVYGEAEHSLYTANEFQFDCRSCQDDWTAGQTLQQLAAVRFVKTHYAHIFDSINMSGLGGCEKKCRNYCTGSSVFTAPFSMLFPNLKRIGISVDGFLGQEALDDVKRMAEQTGMEDWKDFVKKERAGVVVAVVVPTHDLKCWPISSLGEPLL